MKLAFSTLGCPDWGVEQIIEAARANGYDGVELRHLKGTMDLPKAVGGFPGGAPELRRRFQRAGLEICCLGSSVRLTDLDSSTTEGERMIELAMALGASYVRVFGGDIPAGESKEDCVKRAAAKLAKLGQRAAQRGKRVLLETHDAFSSGSIVSDLLAAAGEQGTGALWDLHHPYRLMNEQPAETASFIAAKTFHVHVKDSKKEEYYCLLGEGNIPLRELVSELHKAGYRGYLSLEWEKAWQPALPGPEIAFPQAARYLSELLAELGIPRG